MKTAKVSLKLFFILGAWKLADTVCEVFLSYQYDAVPVGKVGGTEQTIKDGLF